uniref:Ion_trans domain-containing protein n=1 Tax=Panagrellus redivivus TaxID=6233 RepID=A0A7E4V2A9_PANRE
MLCAHGADPNWQDSNLNTVLHICTIRENWMFEHIVEEEREVHWTYGGVMSAAYPLEHLDSIEPSTAYFILVFICFNMRPTPLEREKKEATLICFLNLSESWKTMNVRSIFYAVLNFVVVICAALYLLQMYNHIRNVGRAMYFLSLSGFPAKAIFLVSCGLMLVGFVLRILCLDDVEDMIWIVTVLLTALKFLFFCRGFKSVGPFVMMLYKIILRDLIRFFLIYFIIVIGFSQSFYIIFLGFRRTDKTFKIEEEGTIMYNIGETFIRMFIMSLTEFGVLFEQLEQCELGLIGKITFIIYMLLVTMLLINLLIAMMTNTYTEVSANSLEWLRQWSAIILMMEQSFDPKTRLKYQRMYSIPMEDGKRIALLMKLRRRTREPPREN